jgi:hypothetical protein
MSVLGRGRVSDPYPFDTDPVQVQHFMLNIDQDPDPIRIQGFDDQKMKKVTAEIFFSSKTTIYLSPAQGPIKDVQVTEEAFSSQKNIQHC